VGGAVNQGQAEFGIESKAPALRGQPGDKTNEYDSPHCVWRATLALPEF